MIRSQFQIDNPWRPVDARYLRAMEIIRQGKRHTRCDDRVTARLVAFLRRLARCRSSADLEALREEMPDMHLAFRLSKNATLSLQSTLEARLLAGEPADSIARKMSLTPGAVEEYRYIFFDIESRRNCVDFIVHQVIGRPSKTASEDEIEGYLKKIIGYSCGWQVLDQVFSPGASVANVQGMSGEQMLATYTEGLQRFKAAMATERLSTSDEADRRELLRAFSRTTLDDAENGDKLTTIEMHVAAMLRELPWLIGSTAESAIPEPIREFDRCAAELTADELMLVCAGDELPNQNAEEIKGLPFPPPGINRNTLSSPPAENGGDASAPTASSS